MSFPSLFRTRIPESIKKLNRDMRRYRRLFQARQQFGPNENYLMSAFAVARLAVIPQQKILFYPVVPDRWQTVYKACALNEYRIVEDPNDRYDIVHKHEKNTRNPEHALLRNLEQPAINVGSNDVSKTRVQEIFHSVFGYQLGVDPYTYRGKVVRKSDANYRHDGKIINCPVEVADEGEVVYQRLVETDNGQGYCVDYRVPYYGGTVPFVYVKLRPSNNRFETFDSAEIVETSSVLTVKEVEQIAAFAQAMGLDFGEMDVLRDNEDGRIYIVDVNNTPAGPPVKLSPAEQRRAASLLAGAYRQLVEKRAHLAHG